MKNKKVIIVIIVVVLILLSRIGSVSKDSKNSEAKAITEETKEELKLQFGELLDIKEYESGVIIKAKIESNLTKNMTIGQNFHSVCKLITDEGFNKYDEIKYWAVADMTDGSESKVIQFTLDKHTIDGIYEGTIYATQLKDRDIDLWLHPSLRG